MVWIASHWWLFLISTVVLMITSVIMQVRNMRKMMNGTYNAVFDGISLTFCIYLITVFSMFALVLSVVINLIDYIRH